METSADSTCLFCGIAGGKVPSRTLFADDDVVAFADIAPAAPTHALVIPRRHVGPLAATGADHGALLGKLLLAAGRVAREADLGEGYRVAINQGPLAGQTVAHLHLHVLGGRALGWPPG